MLDSGVICYFICNWNLLYDIVKLLLLYFVKICNGVFVFDEIGKVKLNIDE